MQTSSSSSSKKRFIESSSFYTNCQEKDPFSKFKIDDCSFLESVPNRSTCSKCHRSRKYYCYTCYVAVQEISDRLPHVSLPIKIDIIKHPKEVDGKSTAAHAAVLASEDVTVYTYPNFPTYNYDEVLLIFPGESAIPFHEWWSSTVLSKRQNNFLKINPEQKSIHFDDADVEKPTKEVNCPLKRIIFIDSTWRQSKALHNDSRLKKLRSVFLDDHKSLFWRYYREKKETHLSTIEAIYYFIVELHNLLQPDVPYHGQYDNMLFFFKFMYYKIRTLYDPLKLKAYQNSTVLTK
ncbi:tRNA-uridine aminocarboxypropyltransferase 1 isoform X1 [Parasteatoda tepidariorum]|uniref:tRNA-uridine aminocarboxypropyltransferase 1 isoform X1 n=1 Tax=Parasteatoda tepidariorum TaxID=114398 RepID=UPI001C71F11C|nr:tRNA-uridine aminocarboxypropyltransferase 1 isoform X1 [Parasteatoda tepidariorum]